MENQKKKLKSLTKIFIQFFLITCLFLSCSKTKNNRVIEDSNSNQGKITDDSVVKYNYTNNVDLIELLDSSYIIKTDFAKSKKADLLESLLKGFENHFRDNYIFFLKSDLSSGPLFFYPLIQKNNLFVLGFEKTGFLIIDRNSKMSLFLIFDIRQSVKKKIDLKYFFACHFLDKNLLNKFSIIRKNDSLIIQKYFPKTTCFIIEQGKLDKEHLDIQLLKNYFALVKTESKIENKEYIIYRKDTSYFNYGNRQIFFLPTFNIPYEDLFDE